MSNTVNADRLRSPCLLLQPRRWPCTCQLLPLPLPLPLLRPVPLALLRLLSAAPAGRHGIVTMCPQSNSCM